MFKVFTDEYRDLVTRKPHYIMVELETGKCTYISPESTYEDEIKSWNNDELEVNYDSIYKLHREVKSAEAPIIYGAVIGTFESIKEAYTAVCMNDLLE